MLEEENLTSDTLLDAIKQVETNKQVYIDAMAKSKQLDSIDTVIGLINEAAASKTKNPGGNILKKQRYFRREFFYIFTVSNIFFISSSEKSSCVHWMMSSFFAP